MELVFLERIRRRKIALNIMDNSKAAKDVEAVANDVQEEDSEEEDVGGNAENGSKPATIAQIIEDESAQNEIHRSQPQPDSIVLGAIPITALKSALSLDSTVSLPPLTHFCFLLALTRMIDEFPFYGDATDLRGRLNNAIEDAFVRRFNNQPITVLFRSALPLFRSTAKTGFEKKSEIEIQEELESSDLLKKASHLNRRELSDVERQSEDGQVLISEESLKQNADLATLSRTTLDDLRRRVLALDEPTDAHMSVQIRLIQHLRSLGSSRELGDDFDAFLTAYTKRVLQDAKRLGNAGNEVELARLQGLLTGESLKSGEQISNCVRSAIEASQRYGKDQRYAAVAARAVLDGTQRNLVNSLESQKLWRMILRSVKGTDHADVWQIWCDSLSEIHKGKADKDHVRLVKELQHVILHDVVGEKDTQAALLERLYKTRRNSKEALELLEWTKVKGVASPAFWRSVVVKSRTDCRRTAIRKQEAITLFTKYTQRMSRTDVDGMVKLEREWKKTLNEIRQSDEDSDDDQSDAEEESD
ncbi:hypothetical protein L7F22_039230 [Adiantum nelumboides]|nr:hypothetical protein [Adiantum nelumboides]